MRPTQRRGADGPTEETNARTDDTPRRTVLKAMGAGTALPLFGGVGAASTGRDGARNDAHGDGGTGEIDPVLGYTVLDADESLPDAMQPDHVVRMPFHPPTDDRPAFFTFEPVGLHVRPGEVVAFEFSTAHHTVTSYHPLLARQPRLPDGVPPFSSAVLGATLGTPPDDDPMDGWEEPAWWLYRFTEEGVYDLNCAPHEVLGMVMRIVVGEANRDAAYVDEFAPFPAGPPPFTAEPGLRSARDVLSDPQLAPDRIAEAGAVGWDDLGDGEPEPEPPTGETVHYQVDFVEGEPIEELTDDESGDYSLQNRLIRFLHGSSEEPITRTGAPTHTLDDDVSDCVDVEAFEVANGQATVEFTVEEGCELTLSLASYEKEGPGWSRERQHTQELADGAGGTFGPGTYAITVGLPGGT